MEEVGHKYFYHIERGGGGTATAAEEETEFICHSLVLIRPHFRNKTNCELLFRSLSSSSIRPFLFLLINRSPTLVVLLQLRVGCPFFRDSLYQIAASSATRQLDRWTDGQTNRHHGDET